MAPPSEAQKARAKRLQAKVDQAIKGTVQGTSPRDLTDQAAKAAKAKHCPEDLWTRLQDETETDSEDYQSARDYRDEERMAEMPVPFCCPKAAGLRAVFPSGLRPVIPTDGPRSLVWKTEFTRQGRMAAAAVVTHCPFCGKTLPKLVKKAQLPEHLGLETDEHRCSICDKRFDGCQCSHPESGWEAENAPPVFSIAAFITSPEISRHPPILAVSRKTDPNDMGLPGGKLDPGETVTEALCRELKEETGLTPLEYHLIFDAVDEGSGKRCQTFRVTKWEGELGSQEKGVIAWVDAKVLAAEGATFKEYNYALLSLLNPYWLY